MEEALKAPPPVSTEIAQLAATVVQMAVTIADIQKSITLLLPAPNKKDDRKERLDELKPKHSIRLLRQAGFVPSRLTNPEAGLELSEFCRAKGYRYVTKGEFQLNYYPLVAAKELCVSEPQDIEAQAKAELEAEERRVL